MYGGEHDPITYAGAICCGCCVGDDSGEFDAKDDRSDALALWMEKICVANDCLGQWQLNSADRDIYLYETSGPRHQSTHRKDIHHCP